MKLSNNNLTYLSIMFIPAFGIQSILLKTENTGEWNSLYNIYVLLIIIFSAISGFSMSALYRRWKK